MNKVNLTELIEDIKQISFDFARILGLTYGGRTGLSVILRCISLLRQGKIDKLFSFQKVFAEKHVVVRVEAMRMGLFLGGFASVFKLLKLIFEYYSRKRSVYHSLIAGFVASLSCLFLESDFRRTLALYVIARAFQSLYNWLKKRGYWHFWGSDWEHGDTALFGLASAQIMYAYVMRPETLPKSYYKFIVRTGPIDESVLNAVRANNRNKPIALDDVFGFIKKTVPDVAAHPGYALSQESTIVPCSVMHPQSLNHVHNTLRIVYNTAKQTAPLYGALTLMPLLLLRFRKLLTQPLSELKYFVKSTIQSTAFISAFVGLYQTVICAHRSVASVDNRFIYYIGGLVASLSLLIEKKSRRSDLALYALPRGLDSLYLTFQDKKFLSTVPYGDALLIALGMSGIMYCYDYERDTLSPLIQTIIKKLLSDKSHPQKRKQKKHKRET
eukprot:TRINITY_DN5107_c0_g1_i1.p1 TRINITY_DN5107_c0_g1~~TRINITY_DN5107_c0_g1_i1.p1  ORF type:complete len:453 (+),score=61.26 TRINITY_DN5107_c0_g1_i1:37-1359(+)